jgi:ABC-type uncharacterized transport system substrate-binding protein
MRPRRITTFFTVIPLITCFVWPANIQAAKFKVLVVMSYEEDNPWCKEIKEGIESILSGTSEIVYVYMDTKINLENGPEKAKQAYALFQQIKPDGVITADDNAQKLFVLPYLKDRYETPVMFCGVNAEAEQYGFPTPSVSGILERGHIRESLALAKQFVPSIQSVAFLTKESPSGRALLRQVESESEKYIVNTSFHLVNSLNELSALDEILNKQSDAIYIDSMEGVKGVAGKPLSTKDVIKHLIDKYHKPIIGANQYHVEQGALCAVVKTGQEQGRTAAEMLQRAMQGTPVAQIPIVQNFKGKRVINVTAMKALNLRVRPIVLLGAKLVKSSR